MRTVPLTTSENLYAIILAVMVIPWGALCKIIVPTHLFDYFAVDERPMEPEEKFNTTMMTSRRSSYIGNRSMVRSDDSGNF